MENLLGTGAFRLDSNDGQFSLNCKKCGTEPVVRAALNRALPVMKCRLCGTTMNAMGALAALTLTVEEIRAQASSSTTPPPYSECASPDDPAGSG